MRGGRQRPIKTFVVDTIHVDFNSRVQPNLVKIGEGEVTKMIPGIRKVNPPCRTYSH